MFRPHLTKLVFLSAFAFCLMVQFAHAQDAPKKSEKIAMGWVENITIADIDAKLKGKLDTGAKTSSVRAEVLKIVRHKKGERRHVIFQIVDADGKASTLERTLERWVRIKSKKANVFYRRPVVDMAFCLGGKRIHAEVNLAPRKDFIYPILVGRNMLREANIVVDADKTFTTTAHCPADDAASAKKED